MYYPPRQEEVILSFLLSTFWAVPLHNFEKINK